MKNSKRSRFGRTTMAVVSLCVLSSFSSVATAHEGGGTAISNVYSGALITVWKWANNSWLYGYTPYDARKWVDVYNWEIIYNSDSTLTFKNRRTNNCLQAAYHSKGLVHNKCNKSFGTQKFSLWPSASGAIQIKNVKFQECIEVADSSESYAFNLILTTCAEPGSVVDTKQLWVLGPERNASKSAKHDEL